MIIPPPDAKSYYIAHLSNEVAHAALDQLLTLPEIIETMIVLSDDKSSDIEPTLELQAAVQKLMSDLDGVESTIKFNPLYIPHAEPIEDVQYNSDGDVIEVSGFDNPYVTASVEALVDGKKILKSRVCYRAFELPALTEALEPSTINAN